MLGYRRNPDFDNVFIQIDGTKTKILHPLPLCNNTVAYVGLFMIIHYMDRYK